MRRRDLEVSDQDDPARAVAEARESIGRQVHRWIGDLTAHINLSCACKLQQFETDLVEAILWCLVVQVKGPNKRYSDIRHDLSRVSREAIAAEKHLALLRNVLTDLPTQYAELLESNLESVERVAVSLVGKQIPWFHALSSVAATADLIAQALSGKDKGGAPKKAGVPYIDHGSDTGI